MPTSLSSIPGSSQKKFKLLLLFILFPLFFYAQSLTGLWIGVLSNDSNTVRNDQSFEIALTEYKGKVYGYSRSEFIVDDVLYFMVKRVKGTIEGDVCEVKDDEIIAFNFRGKLDKGVKVSSTFRRNKSDSSWYLEGTWKTNQTKNYYSVTGKVNLEEEKDLTASKIFPHLEELKLANDVTFYKDRVEGPPIVKIARPEKIKSTISAQSENLSATSESVTIAKPNLQKAEPTSAALVTSPAVAEEKMPAPIAANKITKEETVIPSLNADRKTSVANNVTIAPASTSVVIKNKPESETITTNKDLTSTSPEKDKETVVVNIPSENKTKNTDINSVAPTSTTAVIKNKPEAETLTTKKEITTTNPEKSQEKTPVVSTTKTADNNSVVWGEDLPRDVYVKKTVVNDPPKTAPNKESVIAKNSTPKQNSNSKTTEPANKQPVNNSTVISTSGAMPDKPVEIKENESLILPMILPVTSTLAERNGAAESINSRKTEISQVVNFKSDSLQLALYDNGQIDGDTVSVLMNGEVILAKQGLKASAIRKTIYITSGKDNEFTLVLYAENLGSFPPNTGLLVVRDGEDVYNLRFSSDFQKNAGIVFRRKK